MDAGKGRKLSNRKDINIMLKEDYIKLDVYRKEITPQIDKELIENKERELGIKIPERMAEFYEYYGNDKSILCSDFELCSLEQISITDSVLCFGKINQGAEKLGIKLEDLDLMSPSICFKRENETTWFIEEGSLTIFFFRIVCWQLLMSMNGIAKVEMSDKKFKSLIGNAFNYLNDKKLFLKSPLIPVIADNVLGCYLVRDGLLYLGTNEEDDVLNEFEEKYDLDLDWL